MFLRSTSQFVLSSRSSAFISSRCLASGTKDPLGNRGKGTDKVFGQDQPTSESTSDKVTEQRVKDYNKGHQAEGTQIPGEFKNKKGTSKDQSSFVSTSNQPSGTRKFSTTKDIKKGAQNVAETVKQGVKDAANSSTGSSIKDAIQQGYQDAKHAASNVSTSDVKGAAKQAANAAYNAKEDFKREADRAASTASAKGSGVVDSIKTGVYNAAEAVAPMASKGYQVAKDAINSDTAQNLKEAAKDTAKSAWQKVSEVSEATQKKAKEMMGSAEQKNKEEEERVRKNSKL